MLIRFLAAVLGLVLMAASTGTALAQQVGDQVQLIERAIGIPGHPGPGITAVNHRYPSSGIVEIIGLDPTTGWFEVVDTLGDNAWITSRYILSVVETSAPPDGVCYEVGAWNLEHFGHGKARGFPENTKGGPSYPPRTAADIAAIARVIRDQLDIKILVLSEINGEGTGADATSQELDDLTAHLGATFAYDIASSGKSQRIALIYDTRFVRPNAVTEIEVDPIKIQGKDIFDRDPLIGHFTFLVDGTPHNDLLVVGLHLASGQHNNRNHDAAMARLLRELDRLRAEGTVLQTGEFDILLAGDLNANMFDSKVEEFFTSMDSGDWDVLAEAPYPATRLSGTPLQPRNSQIDYIIVSRVNGARRGLSGEEITDSAATVHQDLADGDWDAFREQFSDHFPVTTCVEVMPDAD